MSDVGLFDYVNSINSKKYMFTDNTDKKDYVPFVVNVAFSYFPDTIFIANEANKYPRMSIRMHYDFMYHMIRKGKRFSKWSKKDKMSEDMKLVSDFYDVSLFDAKQYLEILSSDQLDEIRNSYGGRCV